MVIYVHFKTNSKKFRKSAGGIRVLSIHNVRATGSILQGKLGLSNGICTICIQVLMNTRECQIKGGWESVRDFFFAIYVSHGTAQLYEFWTCKKTDWKGRNWGLGGLYLLPCGYQIYSERVGPIENWTLMALNECLDYLIIQ